MSQSVVEPVTQSEPWPWFQSPNLEGRLGKSGLDASTQELVRKYAKDGYLIVEPEMADFDRLASQIRRELKYGDSTRIQDAWRDCTAVRQLAIQPKILQLLEVLYRREPVPFQTLNFCVGTQQRAHSDSIHFQSMPRGFMCGVWFALEDIDEDNGPLFYYPGSHTLPYIELQDLGRRSQKNDNTSYEHYVGYLENLMDDCGFQRKTIAMPKGSAIIWAANLVHGGGQIFDKSRTRHSQVTHYFFKDCLYYTPLLSEPFHGHMYVRNHLVDIRDGQKVTHCYQGERLAHEQVDRMVHWCQPPTPHSSKAPHIFQTILRRIRR